MSNETNTATNETATEKDGRGRKKGFKLNFTFKWSDIKEKAGRLGLRHIKITTVTERQRTFPEIMELMAEAQTKGIVPTPALMAEWAAEKIEGGVTIGEMVEKVGEDAEITIPRGDIVRFFKNLEETAIALFVENDLGNRGEVEKTEEKAGE